MKVCNHLCNNKKPEFQGTWKGLLLPDAFNILLTVIGIFFHDQNTRNKVTATAAKENEQKLNLHTCTSSRKCTYLNTAP